MPAFEADLRPNSHVSLKMTTPHGFVLVTVSLGEDGAIVAFIDTEAEAVPDVLRLNVNDGAAWNYEDATRWYGDDLGHPFPEPSTST